MAAPIEMRCPVSGRLFGKVRTDEVDTMQTSIEFACRECRVAANVAGDQVALFLHLFNGAGEFVDSVIVRAKQQRPLFD